MIACHRTGEMKKDDKEIRIQVCQSEEKQTDSDVKKPLQASCDRPKQPPPTT